MIENYANTVNELIECELVYLIDIQKTYDTRSTIIEPKKYFDKLVLKVGNSSNFVCRVASYGKIMRLLCAYQCKDRFYVEKMLIGAFKEAGYELIPNTHEYFLVPSNKKQEAIDLWKKIHSTYKDEEVTRPIKCIDTKCLLNIDTDLRLNMNKDNEKKTEVEILMREKKIPIHTIVFTLIELCKNNEITPENVKYQINQIMQHVQSGNKSTDWYNLSTNEQKIIHKIITLLVGKEKEFILNDLNKNGFIRAEIDDCRLKNVNDFIIKNADEIYRLVKKHPAFIYSRRKIKKENGENIQKIFSKLLKKNIIFLKNIIKSLAGLHISPEEHFHFYKNSDYREHFVKIKNSKNNNNVDNNDKIIIVPEYNLYTLNLIPKEKILHWENLSNDDQFILYFDKNENILKFLHEEAKLDFIKLINNLTNEELNNKIKDLKNPIDFLENKTKNYKNQIEIYKKLKIKKLHLYRKPLIIRNSMTKNKIENEKIYKKCHLMRDWLDKEEKMNNIHKEIRKNNINQYKEMFIEFLHKKIKIIEEKINYFMENHEYYN